MTLFVYAAPDEGEDLPAGMRRARIGVGKAAAAAGLWRAVTAAAERPRAVVLLGICGAYPAEHLPAGGEALGVLDVCAVDEQVFADEGVEHEGGFASIGELGLGEVGPWHSDPALLARVKACWPHQPLRVVRCATVSTCSGTDARSAAVAARSGASVETMESAAVAMVCRDLELPLVELRCVSNRTGDRARGAWDRTAAFDGIRRAVVTLWERGAFGG